MAHSLARAASALAISATLAIATSQAAAAPAPNSPLTSAVAVNFGDLNIATAEGTRVLYDRLGAAARAVCSTGASWDPKVYFSQRECYRATLDSVVSRLNLQQLTALHRARTQHASESPHLQARNR